MIGSREQKLGITGVRTDEADHQHCRPNGDAFGPRLLGALCRHCRAYDR